MLLAAAAAAVLAHDATAQDRGGLIKDTVSAAQHEVQRARSGAGLRVGAWRTDLAAAGSGLEVSTTPALEAYWQKGLDRHLVLETGVGVWARTQRSSGATAERVASYVVPMTTTAKLFPFTGPEARLEPYLAAGAGFTLGIDDRETTSGGLFGGTGSGVLMTLGFTLRGGTGVELHLSRAFGLQAGAAWQWTRFFEELGGERTYDGLQVGGGLTYRFQF